MLNKIKFAFAMSAVAAAMGSTAAYADTETATATATILQAVEVTVDNGIDFGTIIGFAILTETVFQWPGLGSKVATAAGQSDLPVVLALSMVVMLIYGLANLAVDISYAKLDPRIRLAGAK